MRRERIVGGLLLIVAGILFLLQNFGMLPQELPLLWVTVFGLGGFAFLYVYLTRRAHWWPLIPGFTLVGLALLVGLTLFESELLTEIVAPALFLGFIGLAFWCIYLLTKGAEWWAIIPGGVLFSVTALLLVEGTLGGGGGAAIMLLGLSVTFGLIYLLPNPHGRMRWPLIPAGILLVLGLALLGGAVAQMTFIWAALLILGGGYLILRALRSA